MGPDELTWIYAFNIIVNSVLMFITVCIFLKIFTFLFRLKDLRIKMFCLCIPIIKIIVDLFLYDSSNWALNSHINPLECEVGSRTISISIGIPIMIMSYIPFIGSKIHLLVGNDKSFTLADLAALYLGHLWVKWFTIGILSTSIILFSTWLFRLYQSFDWIASILKTSYACPRPILNPILYHTIQKSQVKVLVSSSIDIPCALGIFQKHIVLPNALLNSITQTEFEAIIAHELNHLCWYDSLVRLFSRLIKTLFWWIPMKWWLLHLEHTQEQACDFKIERFNISKLDLASAILKAAKYIKKPGHPLVLNFVEPSNMSNRIYSLLYSSKFMKNSKLKWLQHGCIGILMITLLFGRFWIF